MSSLGEEFPKEQARLRELLAEYKAIPAGVFAATMMEDCLRRADQAAVSGDVVKMIQVYEEMKGYE
jgi:ribulose 1,5-bisphosphate synthetase/thiazole synthase